MGKESPRRDILLLESGPFMKLNSLKLDGNYLYHNKVHPDYVDTSTLNLDVSSVSFRLLSPVVTGLANVYDNLFGTSRCVIYCSLECSTISLICNQNVYFG